ncbi:MAG TPA: tRNA pseudouridine(38-40) synthase TruA [Solirubrobacterales bacterium]|nr:tRNA pseudouridine(38-40) synthase TruA [Solirubrobacterales bacterium]
MGVVRLTLAYDGTGFRGWARQRDQRTVEGVLTHALSRFLGSAPRLSVAGRTDAGVHARGQVASFAWPEPVDLERLQRALNGMLAPEVVVLDVREAPEGFHARSWATAREYRYRIDTGPWPDPFEARYVWHRPGELSVLRMRAAARVLVGEHDFASFGRPHSPGGPTVRRLERLAIARAGDRIGITARASAFLHQMVRSMVGTLVAVGEARIEPEEVAAILEARDRHRSKGRVAPARGLTLERVVYGHRPAARSR